jgi:hypothetical protein
MKQFFTTILFSLIVLSSSDAHIITIDGQKYEEPEAGIDQINSKWDFQSSEFPPISLREAYRKAKSTIEQLRPKENWELLYSQFLTTKDKAIYTLVFKRNENLTEEQKNDGVKEVIICISVLMDGTVLSPQPIKKTEQGAAANP